jgi:hypothetical protein
MVFLSERLQGLDSLDRAIDHVTFVQAPILLTQQMMKECSLGLGDEVL